MLLTKLEINGFKSFAKKTELIFQTGITGILGPNGCGKSNMADAFRFVLGEQSARALRGKKVEDFIFGGTEKRKPLSYCEVSMYFDNTDGSLASPYSEVVVSRRAFRSGESEEQARDLSGYALSVTAVLKGIRLQLLDGERYLPRAMFAKANLEALYAAGLPCDAGAWLLEQSEGRRGSK